MSDNLCIVVLGASGDLAFKKTYPALFGLYKNGFLPVRTQIVGYARSSIDLDDFKKRISSKIKIANATEGQALTQFLEKCYYTNGAYDKPESFIKLNAFVQNLEGGVTGARHRVFYMALPPSVFIPASKGLKNHLYTTRGSNRLVVEKPFGKDFDSSKELSKALAESWHEDEIYRIDHYLGKEMVKNLMVIRFANIFFSAVWNRFYIDNVQITFKEKIGTEGRGGYFDEFGIIRDIMQNHLLQILTIVAMEKPVSLDAEHVRDEKVKVLRAMTPLAVEDVLLGQYTASADGSVPGYLEDPGVPKDSVTPTYAAAVFNINNERWSGVPFILKAGKALNEAKAEVRIQFQDVPGNIYGNVGRNELVIRVQPNEAVYVKFMNKQPGLSANPIMSELDLSYHSRYNEPKIPDAYESLILDVLKGDKSNFVRDDELDEAWKLFTPLLHKIEGEKIAPKKYQFGTRGPEGVDDFVAKHGYQRHHEYEWTPSKI
ncbi:glucose-6-phosphate dehydrogenase [Polychytrium aggregatum]|uniref:glucose-6-phosphate dehydrogenase n=1 Tax=Polychytrium aggregatum TaxID=110093 RepID=UPI0022FE0831|nr:glucose-6-phosphate dehydrogenase [Polychytrium aggregatum]KAI9207835.1 glucose-6-phosphate dehydrogenase [Polychytrium aggregatum]